MSEIARTILDAVDQIPRGTVLSYRDVADFIGRSSARGVGMVMHRYGEEVPWHRVVHSDGTCAATVRERQLGLLRADGVPLRGTRVDMSAARWDGHPA